MAYILYIHINFFLNLPTKTYNTIIIGLIGPKVSKVFQDFKSSSEKS